MNAHKVHGMRPLACMDNVVKGMFFTLFMEFESGLFNVHTAACFIAIFCRPPIHTLSGGWTLYLALFILGLLLILCKHGLGLKKSTF